MENNIRNDSRIEMIMGFFKELNSKKIDNKDNSLDKNNEIDGIIGILNLLDEELRNSVTTRDFLESILKTMMDVLIITDKDLIILDVNPASELLLLHKADELIGKSIEIIFSSEMILFEYLLKKLPEKDYFAGFETTSLSKENTKIPVSVSISEIPDPEDQIQKFIFIIHDITEQKRINNELCIAAVTFETHEGIVITDANANILRVNQAFQDITGYSSGEVIGKNLKIMSSVLQGKDFYTEIWQQLEKTDSWSGEIWDRQKNGEIYPKRLTITSVKNLKGETTQYVGIFNDISARIKAEEEIRNLAFYDALTSLPNRRLLMDRFRMALSQSDRTKHYGAVIFLDLDKFKSLNDMKGHEFGDLLLVEVAKRISVCLRDTDTVSRLGGDEFVILLEEVSDDLEQALKRVAIIAEKIRKALSEPYQLNKFEHYSTPSMGLCMYCGSDKSVTELLKSADMAMYQAKESGRNAIRFFDPILQKAIENHAEMESNLRNAVTNKRLKLYYQVQVDNNYKPIGAEALIRWKDPKYGFISPEKFIKLAEESALILDIGEWVIETACQQLSKWGQNEKLQNLTLSINVSARQFGLINFVENIQFIMDTYKIDPSRLKLELTENVLLNDISNVINKMTLLKKLGVWLSIDDFGTGYSSLSYLKQLPIHQLKIDQSFVRNITTDQNDAIMVKTIINMANNFYLDVIAEGVETEEQMNFLFENGCLAYQGYLFGKPMPVDEFEKLILKMTDLKNI